MMQRKLLKKKKALEVARLKKNQDRLCQGYQRIWEESLGYVTIINKRVDENVGEKVWARQNVIHETCLFQGRFGFSRGIILLEARNRRILKYLRSSASQI